MYDIEAIAHSYREKTEERQVIEKNMATHVVGVDVGGTNTGAYFLLA